MVHQVHTEVEIMAQILTVCLPLKTAVGEVAESFDSWLPVGQWLSQAAGNGRLLSRLCLKSGKY